MSGPITIAAGVGWALAHLLLVVPRLPEPPDAVGKTPYRALNTPWSVVAVALLAGLTTAGAMLVDAAQRPLWWVLGSSILVLVWVDLRTTYLPRALTILCVAQLGIGVIASAALGLPSGTLIRGFAGAAASGLFYWLIWRVSRGGIGFGDVRLAPLIGLVTASQAWTTWWAAMIAGSIIGVIWGLVATRWRPGGFAYGPSMLLGAYVALLTA